MFSSSGSFSSLQQGRRMPLKEQRSLLIDLIDSRFSPVVLDLLVNWVENSLHQNKITLRHSLDKKNSKYLSKIRDRMNHSRTLSPISPWVHKVMQLQRRIVRQMKDGNGQSTVLLSCSPVSKERFMKDLLEELVISRQRYGSKMSQPSVMRSFWDQFMYKYITLETGLNELDEYESGANLEETPKTNIVYDTTIKPVQRQERRKLQKRISNSKLSEEDSDSNYGSSSESSGDRRRTRRRKHKNYDEGDGIKVNLR